MGNLVYKSQLTLNDFLSSKYHASTPPVKIGSWLLPMHRKCCHDVVDCTQCIESRYDYHSLDMFWNLSILIMMAVFCSQREGIFVSVCVCLFVKNIKIILFGFPRSRCQKNTCLLLCSLKNKKNKKLTCSNARNKIVFFNTLQDKQSKQTDIRLWSCWVANWRMLNEMKLDV